MIGTQQGGHVFPGASMPYGAAKAGPDTDSENQGGYDSGDNKYVIGFSHAHDDGTGGSPSMGFFPLWAQRGCPGDNLSNCKWQRGDRQSKTVQGSWNHRPGYYGLTLANGITADMTVTNRASIYRFTFGSGSDVTPSPLIHIELNDLSNSRKQASISVDSSTGRMTGSGEFAPSFGEGSYTAYFCADFKGASIRNTGVWRNNQVSTDKQLTAQSGEASGAWVQFSQPSNSQVMARVAISYISTAQACRTAESEIPNWDYDGTKTAAENAWRQKLGVVSVNDGGASYTLQRTFWSGMYRSMLSPQDWTGENPRWQSSEPYFDSFYCIWDSFRTTFPLLTILDPQTQAKMVRSLIDVYRFEGYLPDCRMQTCKGFVQGGSNADVVLVDAYVKGLTDGIDWATGYNALIKDAEVEPSNWNVQGRGGLTSWKNLGYIPIHDNDPLGSGIPTRSVSRTVEYAYNDFVIALMAKGMGKTSDFQKYLSRSYNWLNLFKPDVNSEGFTGYLQPRDVNGVFQYQDPTFCSPGNNHDSCYLNNDGHETYEASSYVYTFFVPQDVATLIQVLGGKDSFVSRLQHLHTSSALLDLGNEPSFLSVYMYHYAGRPGLSAKYAHTFIPGKFKDQSDGIPGNDDSGAMGAFTTLLMIGAYPVAGQDVYLITPPFFQEVNITNPITGKTATIRNKNFDTAYNNIYIQSVTLNGQTYTKNWIGHSFFRDGGVLELTLGSSESSWGTAQADLPPSASTSLV
ncbi:alpha-1,2-mannosidase, putative subfamily [Thozetella sp. PMI_491]|nr:alpha-1,2-mannosidase, putative subfamily [Thozetella sp. PMI_491]